MAVLAPFRNTIVFIAAIALTMGSRAVLPIDFGLNPSLSAGSLTINTVDVFTGTFSVSGGTLYLGSSFTAPASTSFAFTGSGSYLSYTGGGPFTLTLPSTASLTRSGSGNTYVYDTLSSAGNVTVSGGSLQFQNGTTFTNTGTATVTGSSSTLYLQGLANSGTLAADTNGLIQLAGAFTTANLGSVTLASGGAIKLTGSLNNASANLTAPTGGAYTLAGGTITGGTIASATIVTSSTNSTLDGATVLGNLTLNSGDVLSLKNGAGASGTTAINNASLYLATNLSAAANSAYVFTGSGSYLSYTGGGPFTFTLPSTASLTRSGTGATYVYDSIANAGNVTVSGGSLQFQNGTTLTNASGANTTVTGSGSSLYLQGLANSGTLAVDTSGLVQLSGNFTSSGLGNITLASGGVVQLTGNLTNTSLAAPTGGSLTLLGGTVSGGTIAAGALAFTSSAGYLDNASLLDDLSLGTNAYVRFINGAGFTGGNATLGANAGIYWQQSGTLTGKAITFGANSYLYVSGANHALTLDSASTGTGQVRIYSDGSSGTSITNQGNLTNTTGAGTLYAPTLANIGTITNTAANNYIVIGSTSTGYNTSNAGGNIVVNGSNSSIYLDGNVTNTGGTLTATNGQFYFRGNNTSSNLNGGTLNIASGAHAYLNGTIANTSATLAAPTMGSYELYGGTVTGGTIAANALTFTSSGGTLSNVSFAGNLNLSGSTSVTFTNGTSFTGTSAMLGNYATLNWNQNGMLTGKTITLGSSGAYGALYVGNGNALTLGSGTTVSGDVHLYGTTGSSLTNQGSITQTSGTGYFYAPTVLNQGSVTANSGSSLYVGYYSGESTTNAGTGTITADGTNTNVYLHSLVNQGTLVAQNAGQLLFTGTSTTTANLGTVQLSTGGRALLNGTLTNTAATLAAPTGGSYELYGGTINDGAIAAGALTFTSSGGTLSNVSFAGNLNLSGSTSVTFTNSTSFTGTSATLGNYATLNWNQNGTLTGKTITAGSGSAYGYLAVGSNNSLRLGSGTSLTGVFDLYGNTGSTIINQGTMTVSANSGTSYAYAPTFTNQGAITANAGASLYVGYYSGETTTNASGATIAANGAGANIYLQNIVNQGTLAAQSNGALYFQGTTNTIANLGTVQLSTGGHAYINGTINNTSATLNAPTGGSYELYGGTITGGTIAAGALTFTSSGGTISGATLLGTSLALPASTSVTLSNVALPGDVSVGNNASVTFNSNTTFPGANLSLGTYSTLNWNQNGTLAGKTITAGSGGAYGYLGVGSGNSLTLANTTSLTGVFDFYGNTGSTIINQGTLAANSGTSYAYGPTFTNQGAITANAGASLYVGYYSGETTTNASGATITANGTGANIYLQNIVNQGTLAAQSNGALYFQGTTNTIANLGTVQLSTGGHAYINGTINNTSATLNAPTGGSYELYGGTITGGTIAANALTFTTSGGYLDGTTLSDNFTLPGSAHVRFINGGNFTGANATFGANAGVYWQQAGTLAGKNITLGNGAYLYLAGANNTLALGSTTTVTGDARIYTDGSSGTAIANQGTITHNNASYYGQIYAPTFTNSGGISATAGTLYLGYPSSGYNSTNTSGGTITATGSGTTVYLRGNFTNSGSLLAQNSGQLVFDGTNTTGNLGNVTLSTGGRALLNGTLTNASLAAPTGGKFELYGGTISGGTIAANALSFTTSGGYLDNVSLLDDLNLGASNFVRFINNANFTGANATLAGNAGLYWQQAGTLANKTLTLGSGAYLYVTGANDPLTLAPSTSAIGSANIYSDGSSGSTITNQGNITQNDASYYGQLYAQNFTNPGTITATSGTLYLGYPSSSYAFTNTSTGTITVNGTAASVWLRATTTNPFNNAGNLTVQSGALSSSSPLTNSGNIAIAAGTTFNEYSGATFTQTAGTLKIAGTFVAPTGGASISGGSVTGTGAITGDMTFAAGTLDPGGPIGTLTFTGNLTLTGGATTMMELGAGTNDRVTVSGSGNSLVFGGALNILAVSTAFASGQTWNLFTFGTHSGSFATINLPNTSAGWVWDTSQLTNTGALTLTTFVPISVPEPSTYALLAGGLGVMFILRRRLRRA